MPDVIDPRLLDEQIVLLLARHREGRLRWYERPRRLIARAYVAPPRSVAPVANALPGDLDAGMRELEAFARDASAGRVGPIERDRTLVYVGLEARDRERFVLRIHARRYLVEPPRCAFVDDRRANVAEAWPYPDPGGPFRSPQLICTPPTFEYHLYHREPQYRYGDGSLVATVSVVFAALHADGYRGRFCKRPPG
jgi:hypothetical protein